MGKQKKVIVGISGGVDSSVTAALLSKAIGENLVCVFVDNGLLRKNEAEEVVQTFKNEMDLNEASIRFQMFAGLDPIGPKEIVSKING